MATNRKLTPNAIDNLTSGRLKDPERPGLAIEAGTRGKVWRYYRRIAGTKITVDLRLGSYPAFTIADARKWADDLNAKVERGEDPREAKKAAQAVEAMTVAVAHGLYIADISKGDRKPLKPRTIEDKQTIYRCDIQPKLGSKALASVTADDLWEVVEAKGEASPVRANRLAAETKVFFGWCLSRPAQKLGIKLPVDPSLSLNGKHYAESKGKTRFLDDSEIGLLFRALAALTGDRALSYRRAMLLILLTGCRISEVVKARADEYRDGVWTLPGDRVKNWKTHTMVLGAWGRSLMATNSEWLIPHCEGDRPITSAIWYDVVRRLRATMEKLGDRSIEAWSPHDLRRTLRSNCRRLGIDYETREEMLNHRKQGLERRYDVEDMTDYKAEGLAKWEAKLVGIAVEAGVADQLGITTGDATPDSVQLRAA